MAHGLDYAWGVLVSFAIALAPTVLAIALSARLSRSSREEWQVLDWLPSVPLVAWWIYFLIATLRDPTSHNLWPFELVFWMLVSGVLFLGFLAARTLVSRAEGRATWPRRKAPPNEEL